MGQNEKRKQEKLVNQENDEGHNIIHEIDINFNSDLTLSFDQ